MFDINFIEKPGIKIKGKTKEIIVDSSDYKEKKVALNNSNLNTSNKGSNLVGFIVSFTFILFVVFSYKTIDYNSKNEVKNFSINSLLKIISEYNEAQIQSICSDNKEIRFTLATNQSFFYDLLNLFKEVDFNVKGSINESICNIYIDGAWYIDSNSNLLSIRDCIRDFKGIESELLLNNDDTSIEKLIVVSDFSNLISLLDILEKRNLIHSYPFKINKSNNNSNYYEIIFYD